MKLKDAVRRERPMMKATALHPLCLRWRPPSPAASSPKRLSAAVGRLDAMDTSGRLPVHICINCAALLVEGGNNGRSAIELPIGWRSLCSGWERRKDGWIDEGGVALHTSICTGLPREN